MSRAFRAVRESGLVRPGEPVVVMLSGGADSVCLLDVALRLGARVSALHVNHGLRTEAAADEELCRRLCADLEVPFAAHRVHLASAGGPGNLHAEARAARYELGEAAAERLGGRFATAHTASDQAETIVYRLAVSPGRRALLGIAAERGRLVRPLLHASAQDARAHCRWRGLPWREDAANRDLRFARARVRHEILPALTGLNPAAERNLAETAHLLRDEAEVLERVLDEAIGREIGPTLELEPLAALGAALARLALRRLAEATAPAPGNGLVSLSRRDADLILARAGAPGSAQLDLAGGLVAWVEYGRVRFARGPVEPPPPPVPLELPGEVRFGSWLVRAEVPAPPRGAAEESGGGSSTALLLRAPLGPRATVRAWRAGDRMRPDSRGGSRSLQDLLTDAKVPRAERRSLPVLEDGDGRIAWVPGIAIAEGLKPPSTAPLDDLVALEVAPAPD